MWSRLELRQPGLFMMAGAMMLSAGVFFAVAQVAEGAYVLFMVAAILGIIAAAAGCVGMRALPRSAPRGRVAFARSSAEPRSLRVPWPS
jgi:amino acid transporter